MIQNIALVVLTLATTGSVSAFPTKLNTRMSYQEASLLCLNPTIPPRFYNYQVCIGSHGAIMSEPMSICTSQCYSKYQGSSQTKGCILECNSRLNGRDVPNHREQRQQCLEKCDNEWVPWITYHDCVIECAPFTQPPVWSCCEDCYGNWVEVPSKLTPCLRNCTSQNY